MQWADQLYGNATLQLSALEQHIFAFYVAHGAQDLNMTPRFWPYGELVLIVEDKIRLAVRQFGITSSLHCRPVATAFLDLLIEREAFSTVTGSLGDRMHRYQPENFRNSINELLATNPIILAAQGAGPNFWQEAFTQWRE
jgi:hypothetical protein